MAKKGKQNGKLIKNQISCLNCRMADWEKNWCIKLLKQIDKKDPVVNCESYRKPLIW